MMIFILELIYNIMKIQKTKQKRESEVIYKISIPEIKQNIKELTSSEVKSIIKKLKDKKSNAEQSIVDVQAHLDRINSEIESFTEALELINK